MKRDQIHAKFLGHLRIADDITFMSQDAQKLQGMIKELNSKSKEIEKGPSHKHSTI